MKQRIEKMFAFVVTDDDGSEGVLGVGVPGSSVLMLPLVGADTERIESLKPHADFISQKTGKPYRILEFSTRTDVTEKYTRGN